MEANFKVPIIKMTPQKRVRGIRHSVTRGHKGVTEGGGRRGIKIFPNLHDVIYECPLTDIKLIRIQLKLWSVV